MRSLREDDRLDSERYEPLRITLLSLPSVYEVHIGARMKIFQADYDGQTIVMVQPDNLERMKQSDPVTLQNFAGGLLRRITYPNCVRLIVAFEEHIKPLEALAKAHDIDGLIKYVERGYDFKPMLDGLTLNSIEDIPK
jgi:hypothetical protein